MFDNYNISAVILIDSPNKVLWLMCVERQDSETAACAIIKALRCHITESHYV